MLFTKWQPKGHESRHPSRHVRPRLAPPRGTFRATAADPLIRESCRAGDRTCGLLGLLTSSRQFDTFGKMIAITWNQEIG